MPESNCCPNEGTIPSKLNVEVGVYEHDTGECYTANFKLNHSGGEWTGNITYETNNNQTGALSLRLWCAGNDLADFEAELTVSIGSGCEDEKIGAIGANSCDLFYMSFGGNLPPACCGRTAGPHPLDVSVTIWDGPPVADSFPVPVLPPCKEVFPKNAARHQGKLRQAQLPAPVVAPSAT